MRIAASLTVRGDKKRVPRYAAGRAGGGCKPAEAQDASPYEILIATKDDTVEF
jgi:hypothetical protein